MTAPHPDYNRMHFPDDYSDVIGPYYARLVDGKPVIGLRIKKLHVSPRSFCHGSVLAGLSDLQSLPGGFLSGRTDRMAATVTFTLDFMAPAKLGDWIEMHTDLLRVTRQFMFTQAIIRNFDGTPLVRSSAMFKFDPEPHPDPEIVTRLFALAP
jgi:acyl-coenzyme A thioesterase PaaI-like protein